MSIWSKLVERAAGSHIQAAVKKQVREAYAAGLLKEDIGWTRVSRSRVDHDGLRQELSLREVQDLYEANPLAKWSLEMTRDLLTAEGIRVESESDAVLELLHAFWNHDLNMLDINLPNMALELGLWGEQCWPAFTPEGGGIVSLGLVASDMIREVVHDPGNCALPIGVILKDVAGHSGKHVRVIYNRPDNELFTQKVQDLRENMFNDGETFWFKINTIREATRGLSDLYTLNDWLKGYEDMLFGADHMKCYTFGKQILPTHAVWK